MAVRFGSTVVPNMLHDIKELDLQLAAVEYEQQWIELALLLDTPPQGLRGAEVFDHD